MYIKVPHIYVDKSEKVCNLKSLSIASSEIKSRHNKRYKSTCVVCIYIDMVNKISEQRIIFPLFNFFKLMHGHK